MLHFDLLWGVEEGLSGAVEQWNGGEGKGERFNELTSFGDGR